MPHPSSDPATVARRQAEFDRARSAYEVDQLQARWQAEDRAAAAAGDWRTKEVTLLQQRVAALERILGAGGRRLTDDLIAGIGEALRRMRKEDRERLLGEIEARGYVVYKGTWDEGADYARGAMVTCAGSTWIATGPCTKGARPGRAAEWRLATKGGEGGRVVAA